MKYSLPNAGFITIKNNAINTKLTLTIEQAIIEKAKKYAKSKGRSLSNIIENYLKVITKRMMMKNRN